ncbi:serpin-ZX [Tanacetum coccineum]
MVYQLTKFHVQRVDMVINPPWNLPFLGAKGLTSPEQTATGFDLMAKEGRSKRAVSGDVSCIQSEKKPKKVNPTTIISASMTSVMTKTLLYDAYNGFKNGNFICSPLSLDIILGLLTVGAEGETLKQLLRFLRHGSID